MKTRTAVDRLCTMGVKSGKKRKNWKRELAEWVVFLGVIGVLYATGLHTPVLGFFQSLILKTGIFKPEIIENNAAPASYDITLIDARGNPVDFRRFEGDVVFLNFWATWCPPCIAEMPDINDLYRSVGDEVRFVLISLDEDFEKAREFVRRKEFDFPVYRLASPVPAAFDSRTIPSTYILDRNGRIVARRSGMARYNTESFREFLKSL